MSKECRIYMDIYTKGNLSADELVDAFRAAGALKEDCQVTQERMARAVTCSDDPFAAIDFFQKTLDELRVVFGGQHKTLQELKQ